MHKLCGLMLLICSFLLFCAGELHAETRRALLIGIDKYEPKPTAAAPVATGKTAVANASPASMPPARSGWFDLDGAVNDVEAIQAILIARYGFQPGNVRVLRNGEATRERILAEIRHQLIDPAVPGDVAVFFYAGHGSQVNNSQSAELDKKDETIVPADSSQGAWDIRDKELRRLFNDILDKRAMLTVFFDSCHSGSIARGLALEEKARFLPPDPRDIATVVGTETPDSRPAPEERGALVFSAAQDFELANEDTEEDTMAKHGAFSLALLKVLKTANVQESAENLFIRTKALIRKAQEPVLAGPADRRQKPLFGSGSGTASGEAKIAVRKVRDDGTVELQGGLAVGLREKCELKKVDLPAGAQAVRLRVEQVQGWSEATARVIAGEAKTIRPGDLFVMDLWVASTQPFLHVRIPPAVTSVSELRHLTEEVNTLRTSEHVQWINDPTEDTPTHRLEWNGTAWLITKPGKQEANLGKSFTAKQVLAALPGGAKEKTKLFVRLPPPSVLVTDLGLNTANGKSVIAISTAPQDADYELIGRVQGQSIEYAWVRPNMLQQEAAQKPLPVRTDWVTVGEKLESLKAATSQLKDFALRISRLNAWLNLEAPPNEGAFPYSLALKNIETGAVVTTGAVVEGQEFYLVLQASEEALKRGVGQRYVYVFTIDSSGKSTLLFPDPNRGNAENRLPYRDDAGRIQKVTEIPLSTSIRLQIAPPFGIDTYMLLTSQEPIPDPLVLQQEGVRTRGAEPENPLARLLYGVGSETRGVQLATPVNWSIASFSLQSTPKHVK